MKLLILTIVSIITAPVLRAQTYNIFTVTSKADKIFIDSIGDNFRTVKAKAYEVMTTDKKDNYDYYTVKSKKMTLIPNSKEYLVRYKIKYPDLNFQTEVEIQMDSKFRLKDSSAFENIPDYLKKNIQRDIIIKDSAIKIAKDSGLANGDTLSIYLFREYRTGQFFWTIQSEWKEYYAKIEKEYKGKTTRRMRSRTKDTLYINAKTGEVFTYKQMPH